MRLLLALFTLLVSLGSFAADIYNPALTLVKGNGCVPSPERIINVPYGLLAEDFPYNELALLVFYMDTNATANPIGNDPGGYTGLHLTDPALQRGKVDAPGSTVFQLRCNEGGFLVNTTTFPYSSPHAQFTVTWKIPNYYPVEKATLINTAQPGRISPYAPEIRPWPSQEGDPDLVIQASVRVPTVTTDSSTASAQYNLFFYLLDTVSGRIFDYIVNLYDNLNGYRGGLVMHDGQFPFISTYLQPHGSNELHQRHLTRSPYSAGSSMTPWSDLRFFRIHVGRQHIMNAIQDLTSSGYWGFSTDPANYLLIGAGMIQEHSYENGKSMLMGSSFQNYAIYIARTPVAGSISAHSGSGQTAAIGMQFGAPLVVHVLDTSQNPLINATVTFTGPASGASTAPQIGTAVTDGRGEAYLYVNTNDVAGTYTVNATVPGISAPASFTLTNNARPVVTLSTNGTTFTPSTPIVLTANATDSDGSISAVYFYAGATLLGSDTTAPYTFTWTNPQQGTYALRADAFDNRGAGGTSNTVNVVVNPDPSCTPGPVSLDYSAYVIQPNSQTGNIDVAEGTTVTLSFSAGAGVHSTFWEVFNSYYYPQPQRMLWSVSKCKGDFNGTGACYPGTMYSNGAMDVFAYPYPSACQIDPNVNYYLNFKVITCQSPPCGFSLYRMN